MSTDRIAFDALTKALGKELGIEGEVLNEDGIVSLEAGPIPLSIVQRAGAVMLYSALGNLPQDAAEAESLCRNLLSANVLFRETGGAALGVDFADRVVTLCWQAPMQAMREDDFLGIVEEFIIMAEYWQKRLAEPVAKEAAPSGGTIISAAWTSV